MHSDDNESLGVFSLYKMQLNSQRGSALMAVMVAVLLVGLVTAGILSKLDAQNLELADRLAKGTYGSILNTIRSHIDPPEICSATLGGQMLGGTAPGSMNGAVSLAMNIPGSNQATLSTGWVDPTGRIRVTSVRMRTMNRILYNTQPRIIKYDKPAVQLHSYETRLIIDARRQDAKSFIPQIADAIAGVNQAAARHPQYIIDLTVNVNPGTNRIVSCYGMTSEAAACESAGGSYDATSDMNGFPQYRCHPNYRCWVHSSGINRTPITDPVTQPVCPWPFNERGWIGRWNGEDLWLCYWCNNQQWNPGVN